MLHEAMAKLAYENPVVAEHSLAQLELGNWFVEKPTDEPIIEMLDASTTYEANALHFMAQHGYYFYVCSILHFFNGTPWYHSHEANALHFMAQLDMFFLGVISSAEQVAPLLTGNPSPLIVLK